MPKLRTAIAHPAAWNLYNLTLLFLMLLGCAFSSAKVNAAEVWIVPIKGAIGPASSDFLAHSLLEAGIAQVDAVVITLDTPGGLDGAMRDMIKAILASPVPVIAYVTPQGARAASAGTYLLYASHIAAMTPATNVGSSTPVQLGGPLPMPRPTPTPSPAAPPPEQQGTGDQQTDMRQKIINDAAAYIRSLAEHRGRNAEWAEASVREGANLSAAAALQAGVIDAMAVDVAELLNLVSGREVLMGDGTTAVLNTAGAIEHEVNPDWRHRFLSTITNPNVAYLLLMIGLYGLIIEFYSPGLGAPGIVGVICLLLGAYALQMLPINYVGLGLIAFGILLMIAEAMAPSIGILGVGGVAAFVTGSVILFDSELPGFRVSLYLVGLLAATSAAVFLVAIGAIWRARQRPSVSGNEAIVGATAIALNEFGEQADAHGRVHIHGEDWDAAIADGASAPLIKAGDQLQVVAVHGLTLEVEPLD